METTTMGYIGTTIRIHSLIPSQPKASYVWFHNGLYDYIMATECWIRLHEVV